ncbi:MAG TPA: hypothetical protein VGN83_00905 [Falsiroseomonas sp.]|jgi:hypothetical protein|nr:hypothetical protein [Falsiroseomonas sp.]
MSTIGAFLALWNDLTPGREREYDHWHTREHVPERVAAPGFRSGRRYVCATHPEHRWFTLYDLASLGCLESPEYRDLLHQPTPWSASMRPDFRNFLRVPCSEAGAAGFGIGASLVALRLPNDSARPALSELAEADGVVRARLGRRADAAPASGSFRLGADGNGASDAFTAVLLLEALDRGTAERAFASAAARFLPGVAPLDAGGVYDLTFIFPGTDQVERNAHRRQHWSPG